MDWNGGHDNKWYAPARMADGRILTAWQPQAVISENIKRAANIRTNSEYRKYLQDNGVSIMRFNLAHACADLGVTTEFANTTEVVAPMSDLKRAYLTREQLHSRMIAPSVQWRQ